MLDKSSGYYPGDPLRSGFVISSKTARELDLTKFFSMEWSNVFVEFINA